MAIYKVVYREFHQLTISKTQEFDTEDQNDWDRFLAHAKSANIDIGNLPNKAPSDPREWYDLIAEFPPEDYDEHDEDLWTANSGTYETSWELEDESGKPIGD